LLLLLRVRAAESVQVFRRRSPERAHGLGMPASENLHRSGPENDTDGVRGRDRGADALPFPARATGL